MDLGLNIAEYPRMGITKFTLFETVYVILFIRRNRTNEDKDVYQAPALTLPLPLPL